jgi:hypothetical protein
VRMRSLVSHVSAGRRNTFVAGCKCLLVIKLFPVSPKNGPDVNKVDGQSPSANHTIGGRPVHVCQPGAH